MASRVSLDRYGRRVVIQTTDELGIRRGETFLLLGNGFAAGSLGIQWMGRTGRPPTPEERAAARAPYDSTGRWSKPQAIPVDDDQLDDAQALEACRIEQERQPADVVNVAA